MKTCSKCKIEKELSEFTKNKQQKNGLNPSCKCCLKHYREENKEKIKEYIKIYQQNNKEKLKNKYKEYYKENKEKIINQSKDYYQQNKVKVEEYKKQWLKENKNKVQVYRKIYRETNKEKIKQYYKIYQETNKEEIKEKRNKHYLNNKDVYNERMKKWRKDNVKYQKEYFLKYCEENKEKIKEKRKEYVKQRMKNDSLFKFKYSIRSLIRSSFKRVNNKFKKNSQTEIILGCKIEEFISYIQKQFTEGMTLENHGEWHLDHIIPLATAKTEEDVIRLCHYTNYQPLWAEDNLFKSDKIIEKQLVLL